MQRNFIQYIRTTVIYAILLSMVIGISANGIMAQDQGGEVLSAIIENNVITGNAASNGGGIACYNLSPVIRNNLLIENIATGEYGGGAIYIFGTSSNPKITGNTISGNSANSGVGSGIYVDEGTATITNCILWQNGDDLWNCSATYSDVTDLAADPGTGNISKNPLFIQTNNPDAEGYYHIGINSPCFNVGDPAYTPVAGETDVDGKPRITNGRIDMGADEMPDLTIPDPQGPVITDVKLNGTPLVNGTVVQNSGTFTLDASDPSGVSRVEFHFDGILRCTDTNGSDSYSCFWDIALVEDGSHALTIIAYDTLGNNTSAAYSLTVALSPPSAPTISSPVNGMVFNIPNIIVSGHAETNVNILLYNNNVQVGNPTVVDGNGNFSLPLTLTEGENHIQAAASNRGGIGPRSAEVLAILDTSKPQSPTNLSAQSKEGGVIRLTWQKPLESSIKGYNLYRSTSIFDSPNDAVKVNASLITGTSFDNLPPSDGIYYYRVSAIDTANNESGLSEHASAVSDRTAPRAVSIQYMPAGHYDPTTGRISQGLVNLSLSVSEPLLTTPFLSITPNGGVPISVEMTKTSDLEYSGFFVISDSTPNGTAYAIFSARDLVGNRGTSIDSGGSILIDTQGPAVSHITVQPDQPIRNDQSNPVAVTVSIGVNEIMKTGQTPELSYLLSGQGRIAVAIQPLSNINAQPGHAQTWQGTFFLPANAGLTEVENLQFVYRGVDDLDNVSTRILCNNSFQIYQGDLPPLDPPQNLKGQSLPEGKIRLSWNEVEGAAGYQIYRQAPGETTLTAYLRPGTVLEFVDDPPSDGIYKYAVASIRQENTQEAISGMSNIVEIVSDSIPSGAPNNLLLELIGAGIKAQWEAPPYIEDITYSLYRSNLPEITSVEGLTPIMTGITETTAIDSHPSQTDHSYVVTAVDSAGNESLLSNSFYLNFQLLPVSSLKVVQAENDPPVISWTHTGETIAGYNITLSAMGQQIKLNQSLVSALSFTDAGYTGDERRYTVTAVDNNGVESIGRSITLPILRATLQAGEKIKRGIMNKLEYIVENHSSMKMDHVRLKVNVGTHQHTSEEFSIDVGGSMVVPVTVGGYDDLPDIAPLTTTITITPNEGELIEIIRSAEIAVTDGMLALQIFNEQFTRGSAGKVQFTLENTGEEEIEIVTATSSGSSASNEVIFYLLDPDGNVLSSKAYKQNLGENVVTLPNGNTVARIPAGGIFTSELTELPVPLTSPTEVIIELEVARIYFHQGTPQQVSMNGLSTTQRISLIDTSYYGEILTITPEVSNGDKDIVITGRAIDRTTNLPLAGVPLNLVISVSGFDRTYKIYTDNNGAFAFTFSPLPGEAGIYKVRAVHPDVLDRVVQGQFVINRVNINPSTINLNIPKNYEKTISIQVTSGEGTAAHNVRLLYEEQDQPSGIFPPGVHVTLGSSIATLGYKQTVSLTFSIWADNDAEETGKVVLKVKSDETGDDSWGSVVINTQFSQAQPSLFVSPDHVETGMAFGSSITEVITLENRGLTDLKDVSLALISQNGISAPNWVRLNSTSYLGNIAVGEKREVSITFSPTSTTVAEGMYLFYLRVISSNYPSKDILVYVSVTQFGIGNALFKVSDIYTGTVNQNGEIIQGLAGAKITVQNEEVLTVEQTKTTDNIGEALFSDLPAGRYKYRITANNHQEHIGRLWIKPGITVNEQVFLEYNLVTVEWEVVETTIQDRYEIVLKATYETDAPAPVVVAEPASITLPKMKAGDVYYGEFTLTNYGLIRADNLKYALPPDDQNFKYELLKGIPNSLGAKERITVPYRVIALRSLDQEEEGAGSGGGCIRYLQCGKITYEFICSNGDHFFISIPMYCFIYDNGECGGTAGIPGDGGTGSFTWPSGDGKGVSWSPPPTIPVGVICWPVSVRREILFEKDITKFVEALQNIIHAVGCTVNTVLREYNDEAVDLSVKVPGGNIAIQRLFYGNQWHWEHTRNNLRFIYDSLGLYVEAIDKGGVIYKGGRIYTSTAYKSLTLVPLQNQPVFTHDAYKITYSESGYIWEDKSGNWKIYDLKGRMTSYGSRNGVLGKLLYEEGENGRLLGIADRSDRQVVWFEYNGAGQISAVRDSENHRIEYSYTNSLLSKVKDVLGYEATYEYDSNGRLINSTDYAARQSLVSYDGYGNVAKVVDSQGNGHFFQYNYDEAKKEYYAQIKTSSGMIKEVWYDVEVPSASPSIIIGWETKQVNVNGRTIQKIVKDGRNLIIIDEKGNTTRKEFDEWDNLTKVVYPDGSTVSFQYEHKFNQLTKLTDLRGNVNTYQYDSQGNLTRKVEAVGTDSERITTYTYDESGQLLTATIEGDANTERAITVLTYDSDGNLSSITDPEGNKTEFLQYGRMGNLFQMKDPRGYIWQFNYDERGRLISQADPLNNTTTYEYDGANNRTAVINAYLKRFGFEYNEYNKLIKAIDPYQKYIATEYNTDNLPTKIIDQEGKQSRFEYDNEERLRKSIDGAGNQTLYYYDETQETFVSSYKPVRIDYPTYSRRLYYDKLQRVIRETDILDENTSYSTNYTYDKAGNVISRTDKEGNTTSFAYDALNRLIKITDPLALGGITERTYDDRGNLTALKDPNNGVTRYEYDRNNRLVKETKPMGEQTVYEYDAAGNRTAVFDAKGQKIAYEYNALNRLIRSKYFAAGNYSNPVKTVEFTYDNLGNLLSYDDGTTSAAYTYDDLQRKTSEEVNYGQFTLSYSYTYFANGLKKSFTGPDGITIDYVYDDNNRLSSIGIPGKGFITYNTYQWNSPNKITLPGGTTSEYTYDPLMQLKSIAVEDPRQNPLMTYNYGYSPAGNITMKNTEHGNYSYQYDKLYRLTGATNPVTANEAYTYDALGNRLTSSSVTGSWNYNQNNELCSYGNVSFEYDGNGNLISKTDQSGTTTYTYDVEDRLVQLTTHNSQLITYYYDPFGRRLWKDVAGARTYFFYSDEGLIGEYDANSNEIKTYGYAPGSAWTTDPLFQKIGTNYYWYQNDHLGTPQKIVDTNGRIVWSATYDAFGNIHITTAEIENNLRFPGQYYDAETGLYYNWNRYYDPATGRYLRTDPLCAVLNVYIYVFNNPVNLIDSEGLHIAKGALKAGVAVAIGAAIIAALPAAVVASPVFVVTATGLAIVGSAYLGVSTGEVIMGETITGRKLEKEERLERLGANLVGWAALAYALFKEPHLGPVSQDKIVSVQQSTEKAIVPYKKWPEDTGGFLGGFKQVETAKPGSVLSRIGSIRGNYVSPPGTTLSQRGLPSNYPNQTETLWRVVKPFKMEGGIAQPWKDAGGMGIQYRMEKSIMELWFEGYIQPYSP